MPPPPALQLHYHTTWQQPLVHCSIHGGEWEQVQLQRVVSGGGWWELHDGEGRLGAAAAAVNGHGGSAPPLLEFVVTDGAGAWDKAADGANYAITAPGRWHLRQGALSATSAPAVLVVSDLDDTMIGAGADDATAAFTRWWRQAAVPAGSRLVYNTGRALDLFERLLAEKGQVMAEPDMLISSLGTRVYHK